MATRCPARINRRERPVGPAAGPFRAMARPVGIADRAMDQGKLVGAGSVVVGRPRADASVTASA